MSIRPVDPGTALGERLIATLDAFSPPDHAPAAAAGTGTGGGGRLLGWLLAAGAVYLAWRLLKGLKSLAWAGFGLLWVLIWAQPWRWW